MFRRFDWSSYSSAPRQVSDAILEELPDSLERGFAFDFDTGGMRLALGGSRSSDVGTPSAWSRYFKFRISYGGPLAEPITLQYLAQACLDVLLLLDDRVDLDSIQGFPLARYGAQYWPTIGRVEGASSRINLKDRMECLFAS